jgi:MarR family transcriptional regulator, lower aerobic nicotinate degradation pathway regulator
LSSRGDASRERPTPASSDYAEVFRRDPDPVDRRRNIVSITKRGTRTLLTLDSVLDGVQDAVLAPLTRTERDTLVRVPAKLI